MKLLPFALALETSPKHFTSVIIHIILSLLYGKNKYIIPFTDWMDDKENTPITQKSLRGSISFLYVFISLQHKLEYIKSFTYIYFKKETVNTSVTRIIHLNCEQCLKHLH